MEHNVTMKNRSDLVVSGVEHLYSFNDKKVEIRTVAGDLVIEGENLDMGKLSIDDKIISVKGTVNSMAYTKAKKPQESFIKKVFR